MNQKYFKLFSGCSLAIIVMVFLNWWLFIAEISVNHDKVVVHFKKFLRKKIIDVKDISKITLVTYQASSSSDTGYKFSIRRKYFDIQLLLKNGKQISFSPQLAEHIIPLAWKTRKHLPTYVEIHVGKRS